jgi:N-methylhydantoinase A
MASYRIGIDIGGTFTDFSLLDEATGHIRVLKTPSDPAAPEKAVFEGMARIFADFAVRPEEMRYFIHGTTLAVNTVIQRSGAKTAFLVTAGFRDILNIGRHRIPDVFNFFTELPRPLVPRALAFEIPERCGADGQMVRPVDEDAVRAAAKRMQEKGVEAVAVCFLHSYRNDANERAARKVLEAAAPGLYVSLSSEIWPQMREYERGLVAVMNAHVGRKMKTYFAALGEGVRGLGITAPILSTKSNGGVMHVGEAGERPVETLLSGPAAGVIGAAVIGAATDRPNLVTFDMGGTSADVAVVEGEPRYSTENHVGDFPVIMPAIDVTSIGAGGGSISWTDSNGVLKVGPMSAGAKPGPACYGLGGTDATVTDAYVCLGIVDPKRFLGGAIDIKPELAEKAVAKIGAVIGLATLEAAESILRVATSQMYAALVPLLARKGIGYDDFSLLPFGGAGPTHGFLLAREVGIRHVIVPLHPGVLCAAGSLAADIRRDFIRTIHRTMPHGGETPVVTAMREALEALAAEGGAWLDQQGMNFLERRMLWSADIRYLGQSFDLTVPLDAATLADPGGGALRKLFGEIYEQVYGYKDDAAPLEVLDVRASAVGVTPKPKIASVAMRGEGKRFPASPGERRIFLDGRFWQVQVFDRDALPAGAKFDGPAIVEQYDTTTLVPPGFAVTVDRFGNLIGEAQP